MSQKSQTPKSKAMKIEIGEQQPNPFKKVYTPLNSIRSAKGQNSMFSSKLKKSGFNEQKPKNLASIRVKTEAY